MGLFALLASPKNAALALLAAGFAAAVIAWQMTGGDLETCAANRDRYLQRSESLAQEVRAAHAAVTEARAINGRQAQAIARYRADLEAARHAVADLEQRARQADAAVLEASRAARQRDRERRANPDLPSAEVMNAAILDAAGGL